VNEEPQLSLKEMRALLRLLERGQLEASDYEKLDVFLAGVIADAEAAGVERIPLDLTDEDQGA